MEAEQKIHQAIAHIGADGAEHCLHEHLSEVANLAAAKAASFDAASWARLAGLWHDLGKYRAGFQKYIRQLNTSAVDCGGNR